VKNRLTPALLLLLVVLAGTLLNGCRREPPEATPLAAATEVAGDVSLTAAPSAEATLRPRPSVTPTVSPTPEHAFPPAQVVNDEGGPVHITGEVIYTNPFFTLGVAEPVIILEDQTGFVERNESYLMPVESQTLGQITSDFFVSPFSYSIALPIEPQGAFNDVDNDGREDTGLQIFAIAYWTNTFGDPFLEERDLFGGGWSTAYASTRVSEEAGTRREVLGGKLLIYAPDDRQGFPSGFGEDGLLFTGDDPVVAVPAGYSVVDLDGEPFTFDRARRQVIDLIEPEGAALVDYSDMTYPDAFQALIQQLSREYAFTEYKGIDWAALEEALLPRFRRAQANRDRQAYRRALRDLAWSIPDGHVSGPQIIEDFREAVAGGLGFAISDLDDGRAVVSYLLPFSPADQAGIELGAEILTLDGLEVNEAVDRAVAHSAPFSSAHVERLQKLRYATRFPLNRAPVEVSWRYPGSEEVQTALIAVVPEQESFSASSFNVGRSGFEQPVEYRLLEPSGFGYVQLFSFSDNSLLTVQLWERLMTDLNSAGVPALIVDMRQNSGGSGFLADQMAAYFFDEPLALGNTGRYDKDRDAFYFDPRNERRFYLPAEPLRYRGLVAVIVGPNCASACEFFSQDLTLEERAVIVGHYPTAGLGGSIDQVAMPEGERFTFTAGRAVDVSGEIHIEGLGIAPDVRVPVNEETLLGPGDPLLQAAVDVLTRTLLGDVAFGGDIEVGQSVPDTLEPDTRLRYRLQLSAGDVIDILVDSDDFEPILAIYSNLGELIGTTEGARTPNIEGLAIPADLTLLIEVYGRPGRGGAFSLSVVDARE
jgi:C-terminal processing protease CtpA/Prc